jgi:hypothetical protein
VRFGFLGVGAWGRWLLRILGFRLDLTPVEVFAVGIGGAAEEQVIDEGVVVNFTSILWVVMVVNEP